MKYTLILTVQDDETGEPMCIIDVPTIDTLKEKLPKLQRAIDYYEQEKVRNTI